MLLTVTISVKQNIKQKNKTQKERKRRNKARQNCRKALIRISTPPSLHREKKAQIEGMGKGRVNPAQIMNIGREDDRFISTSKLSRHERTEPRRKTRKS